MIPPRIADSPSDPAESAARMAATALDDVGRDPRAALALADRAVSAARRQHDTAATATAHRAAALALRELGDLLTAERRARTALRAAVRADSPLVAETRMTLAFVLLESGRAGAALRQADRAAGESTGLSAARVASQRALILQRMGRLGEASAAYAEALPVLRRHRDRLWEARLLNNRGRLLTDQGHLTRATADLSASRSLLLDAGMPALASDVEWNLALVATLLGDVPLALTRFDTVRAEHVTRGTPNPQLSIDRAEALLSVGVGAEAVTEAEGAVSALSAAGQEADLPHALLVLSQAQAVVGDHEAAGSTARRASRLFRRQRRSNWEALARLTALRADELAFVDDATLLAAAVRAAEDVQRIGWPLAEMDARLIAARAADRLGAHDVRRRQLESAAAYRRAGTVDARLRGWYAEALLREYRGQVAGVRAALTAGLRVLDEYQNLLGATELRANVSAVSAGLVDKGLDMALTSGRAREVLSWADRGRARATRPRPVRPPQDAALTDALAALRQLHAQTVEAQLDGSTPPPVADRRRAERAVVAASRRASGVVAETTGATTKALAAALGERVLIEFVERRGVLACVVVADGRFRLYDLGAIAGIQADVERLHFATRRLATGFGTERSRRTTQGALGAAAAALQRRVLVPSAGAPDRELIIVPSASLHAVLWPLLPGLWDRPFLVAPSAAAWLRATAPPVSTPSRQQPPVLVAGPGLPGADAEIAALKAITPDAAVFRHPRARVADVLVALDGAPLAHIAAHGALRTDNPLFSALLLDDGPLTVYDIEGLRTAPETVVLSSCESGVSSTQAGDELLGLVAALLSIGTRTVVATGLETPDRATGELMTALHRGLGAGNSPASALAGVRTAVDPDDLVMVATAAGFTCFGG